MVTGAIYSRPSCQAPPREDRFFSAINISWLLSAIITRARARISQERGNETTVRFHFLEYCTFLRFFIKSGKNAKQLLLFLWQKSCGTRVTYSHFFLQTLEEYFTSSSAKFFYLTYLLHFSNFVSFLVSIRTSQRSHMK